MSTFFLAVAVRRLSAQRLALVGLCVVAGVALAASSPAGAAAPPGLTIQVVNKTIYNLQTDLQGAPTFGSWAVAPPQGPPLPVGATATWVAQLDGNGGFMAYENYGETEGVGFSAYADGSSTPFSARCSVSNPHLTCQMQNATKTTPWIATFGMASGDMTPPAVQVQVARSLVEESVRAAGVPVVVRSNEPARARVELLAQNGSRHALLLRRLKWGNRDYPLLLRLNRAGLRALDVGRLYRLRVQVTDRKGNRAQTIERRIFIR
jgi:hypothetical protein